MSTGTPWEIGAAWVLLLAVIVRANRLTVAKRQVVVLYLVFRYFDSHTDFYPHSR